MRKTVVLMLFALLILSGLVMVDSVFAQSIPKPSVPEFTIETVSFPYDVPPSTITTIDPYTGEETVTTQPGYHVENTSTQIRIKNQPFTPYKLEENDDSRLINLYYNIRLKGHFSQEWRYYWKHNGSSDGNFRQNYDSEYTVVTIDRYLPSEGMVDFQIEALVGYERGIVTVPGAPGTMRIIFGESSGWSDVVTFTIGENEVSSPNQTPAPSHEPTPTPEPTFAPEPTSTPYCESQQLGQEVILGVAVTVTVIVAGLGLLFYLVKRK